MSERKKRKVYSSEFKAKVGLEALKGEKTVNEIGQGASDIPQSPQNLSILSVVRQHRSSD